MITVSIQTAKIDKARLRKVQKKDKTEMTLLELAIFPLKEPDQYGNTHIVKQSATKEEREAKVQLPIIGNAKDWSQGQSAQPKPRPATAKSASEEPEKDVPF